MKVTFASDDERYEAGAVRCLLDGLERNGHRERVLAYLAPADRAAAELAAAVIRYETATSEASAED